MRKLVIAYIAFLSLICSAAQHDSNFMKLCLAKERNASIVTSRIVENRLEHPEELSWKEKCDYVYPILATYPELIDIDCNPEFHQCNKEDKLTSLEWAREFKKLSLNISYHNISDLSPIADWNKLEDLDIGFNPIKNLDIIEKLSHESLQFIYLGGFNIDDQKVNELMPLFSKMKGIGLNSTKISSIDFIYRIKDLNDLDISNTHVKDFSPIQSKPEWGFLGLNKLGLKSLKPILGNSHVDTLWVNDNELTSLDIIATQQLDGMFGLSARNNQLENADSIEKSILADLRFLNLSHNKINSIEQLKYISQAIIGLDLSNNNIKDITPLRSLVEMYDDIKPSKLNIKANPLTHEQCLAQLEGISVRDKICEQLKSKKQMKIYQYHRKFFIHTASRTHSL